MLLFSLVLCLPVAANASPLLVISRVALGGNDFIDWGNAPCDPIQACPFVPPSFTISSNGGLSTTVSVPTTPSLRLQQGTSYFGDFTAGDNVLSTTNNGPLKIAFAGPVRGAGANIDGIGGLVQPFRAFIEVFDTSNTSLGLFFEDGTHTTTPGTAIFLGVLDNVAEIGRIEYHVNLTSPSGEQPILFVINRLDIVTTPGPEPSTVPEPSTIALFGISLVGMAVTRWWRQPS